MKQSESMEDIVLRHSARGMDHLRQYIEKTFLSDTARRLLACGRGPVLLATGFYVNGTGETDGPPGALFLAEALGMLGFVPVILTDRYSVRYFQAEAIPMAADGADIRTDAGGPSVECVAPDADEAALQAVLDRWRPVAMVAIERCGVNVQGEYANMKGVSIRCHTAPIDRMFEMARDRNIFTIGIGDGGNEIGMGCVREIIARDLQIVPCRVETDALVLATVSNWGAYGLVAALQRQTGQPLLPSAETVAAYMENLAALGSVDGVLGYPSCSADGFGPETEREIIEALCRCASGT